MYSECLNYHIWKQYCFYYYNRDWYFYKRVPYKPVDGSGQDDRCSKIFMRQNSAFIIGLRVLCWKMDRIYGLTLPTLYWCKRNHILLESRLLIGCQREITPKWMAELVEFDGCWNYHFGAKLQKNLNVEKKNFVICWYVSTGPNGIFFT